MSAPTVRVISFGYLHGEPPQADRVVDATVFHDPAVAALVRGDERLLHNTGLDPDVRARVLATDGVLACVDELVTTAFGFAPGCACCMTSPYSIAIGCRGGRHRSVAIAEVVAERLRAGGVHVVVEHRDIELPVVRPEVTA